MDLWNTICLILLTGVAVIAAQHHESQLRQDLLAGYDGSARPSTPTTVGFFYNLRALRDLDITNQAMSLTGWMTMVWSDPRLTWNQASYNNIDSIQVDWAWTPSFFIANSADGSVEPYGMPNSTSVKVSYQGEVGWNKPIGTTVTCDVDISKFPFDTQKCSMEVMFWYFSTNEVVMVDQLKAVELGAYLANGEWVLRSTRIYNATVELCCPSSNSVLEYFEFTFSRRRPFYVMNLLMPAILLSVCMVWVFLLPTECGERLGYALTILLSYTVMLSFTSDLMPTTSLQTPYIATYLLTVLVMCSLCVGSVVLHVKLFYLEDTPYQWLQVVYTKIRPILFLTCCGKKNKRSEIHPHILNLDDVDNKERKKTDLMDGFHRDDTDAQTDVTDDTSEVTWAHISVLLDRLCFYVYFVAVIGVNVNLVMSLS